MSLHKFVSLLAFILATFSVSAQTPPPPVLNPPTNPSSGTYTLTWQPVPGATSYEIFEFTTNPPTWAPGSWNQYQVWGQNTTWRQFTKNQSGSWYYMIRTWTTDGQGGWIHGDLTWPMLEQVVEYIPIPTIHPTSPSSSGDFTLSWDAVPGATSYEIFEFTTNPPTWAPGSWTQYQVWGQTWRFFQKSGGGSWFYSVRAWKQNSQGQWVHGDMSWPLVSQDVDYVPPPVVHAPTSISTDGIYTLSWEPVPGATSYEIFEFNSNPPAWTPGSWTQEHVWGGATTSKTYFKNTSGARYYSVRTWKQNAQGQYVYSRISDPIVAQDVQIVQGAVNQSVATTSAEEDNVNVPIYKLGTTAYRITATHPTYSTSLNNRGADFSGGQGRMLWRIGKLDGSSAEFMQSGFSSPYHHYPTEIPSVGTLQPVSQCPRGLGTGGVQNLNFLYTLKPGIEKNNRWQLTIDFAEVSGTVAIRPSIWIGDFSNPGLHQLHLGITTHVTPTNKRVVYDITPTSNSRYWRDGTDQIYISLETTGGTTAGAYANFDCLTLDAVRDGIFSIGSRYAQPNTMKLSGYADNDVYHAEDLPASGTDEPSTEFPKEINEATLKNQYIRFTTDQRVGGNFSVNFWQVNGTLSLRAKTWNGSGWVDQGRKTFTSSEKSQTWTFPDGTFIEGVDANQIWLHVESQAEGGSTTSGASGLYTFVTLQPRATVADQITTLYDAGGVKVTAVKVDGWWRGSSAMNVSVSGGSALNDAHYLQIHKQIPGQTGFPPQVFVLYQDGNARIIPFKQTGQTEDPPFGSSVVIGPAPKSARPFVDISSVSINPQNLTLTLAYRDGTQANVAVSPAADRSNTVVDVSGITYNTYNYPFATMRSMWVNDGDSDCDTIETTASGENPILGSWTTLQGTSWMFKRKVPSLHNTRAPDIKIETISP